MGLLSRVKGRLKDEIKRRTDGGDSVSEEGDSAPIPRTAGPDVLPDPDVRPQERDADPWFLDGEQDGWDATNPDD